MQRNGSNMSREDVYNSLYGSEEEDSDFDSDFCFEEDDSECEAFPNGGEVLRIANWFCVNCTLDNVDNHSHCYSCGEHRRSGILEHGFLASPNSKAGGLIEDVEDGADRVDMKTRPHPERPDRLRAIASSLATAGIFPGRCSSIQAREITREELQKVHSLSNIEAVEHTNHYLSSYFTPDTYANQYSARAARLAAGLCVDLAKAICSGTVKNGFALVRPPGHHAGVRHAMGFCLHNNAAIAASAAQLAGAKKILIIDWDVHHGNGTQEIFDKSNSVLYVSLHRHEGGNFYPGTGAADEIIHLVGIMGAEGYCVNIPWSNGGVGDNDYVFAFKKVVLPIASMFDPDFTIISAGFDAARGDPLGCCEVTPTGYAQMTQMCNDLSGGKLMVILEGGYNLRSISSSATAVIKVLLGENCDLDVEQATPTPSGLLTVLEVLKIQMKYWPSLASNFLELQSNGGCTLQDKKKRKREKGAMLPPWWKLGRKRWLYPILCKRLIHQSNGY